MLYVGVDVHKATSQITVLDETGKVVKRKRVPTSPLGVVDALQGYHEPLKAVWRPVTVGADVGLARGDRERGRAGTSRQVRAIAEARIKTDHIDSETLAHLLRADLIPKAYAPLKEARAVKRVLRQRMFFVRVRTMLKNRIRALLSQHAVALPDVSDLYGVRRPRGRTRMEG